MEKIKDIHVFWAIIMLMVIRIFQEGRWVSCVTIIGLLIAMSDMIRKVYQSNQNLTKEQEKIRYGILFIIINVLFGITMCLLLVNLAMDIKALYSPILIDEISFFTLLLTLPQNRILTKINNIIRKEKEGK